MGQVSYGTITITDTNDIERIYMVYAGSSSDTTAPDKTNFNLWKTDITQVSGDYIWQRTVVKKSGINITSSNFQEYYGDPVCITGPEGAEGAPGTPARKIVSVIPYYYLSTSNTEQTGGSWNTSPAAYPASGTYYYWTKTITTYDSGSPTESSPVLDRALNSANEIARSANSTAAAANTKADNAVSTANSANQTANQTQTNLDNYMSSNDAALNALQTKTKYFWTNLVAHTNGSGGWTKPNYPIGTYAASGINGTTFDSENSNTYGYNTWYANGIHLRYNAINLGQLTGSALTFYHPSTNTQGAKAMELSANALKFYDATGTVAQAIFGGTQATVSGTINAYSGQFGTSTNNYWVIDTFYDANQQANYSSLHSKGDSFIQLGDNNTWTISTDKISSGWRYMSTNADGITNPYYFRYKQFTTNGTYYDYGIHIPNILNTSDQKAKRLSDKFLFIRYANYVSDTNLSTLENDNSWTYPFYVDSQGNVRATAFYIGNSDVPVGGGTGTVAERLTQGYGSPTQPVYFNDDGIPTVTNLNSVYLPLTGGNVTGAVTFGSSISADNLTAGDLIINGEASFTNNLQVNTINGVEVGNNPKFTDTVTTVTVTGSGNAITGASASNGAVTLTKGATFLTSYTETDPTVPSWAKAATKPSYALSEITGADDVKAIEALTGTSGLLKKTAANTWALDTSTYITDITSSMITTALGYTPYNSTNPNGYITANHTSTYSLPIAKYNVLGGVKPAYNSTGAATLTTAAAANTSTPTIAAKSTTSGRYYAIEIDKNGVLFVNVPWTNVNSSYLTGITSNDVTTALGFTPYNSTNPNGYTTNTGTVTSVRVQASSPLQSSTSTASSTTLNTTISFINQDANKVLAGPSSGSAAAPAFRKLVANDIPNLSWSKITSDKPTTLSGYGITDAADLTAVTGVEISDAQLTITRANGTSTSTSVTITASQATGATKLIKIVNNTPQDATAGSETLPVYFTGGYPQAVTSIAKLNGTATTYPEFYAPTSAGTSGYVLKSNGSGAPTWIPQSDISSGNTYTTTIATDSGTNQLTLAHGTKYKLTAGGTSFIFTMPTDTDEKLKVAAVTSGTTYYPIVGTGADAATRQYDTTGFIYVGTNGTANGTNGNALLTLGNSTASTAANWKKGTIRLYGTTAYYTDIVSGAPSANRTITLPNATGTIALTSQIPTVPATTGNSTTGISIADHSTTSVGSASNWSAGSASTWVFEDKTVATAAASATSIPNVTSAGSASSWTFEEKTIPNVTAVGSVPSLTVTSVACDDITAWSQGDLTFTMDATDSLQLNISFTKPSLSYTARTVGSASNWSAGSTPTLGTAIKVQSKSGGGNGSAPTLGTPISITGVSGTTTVSSKKSGANSTTPSLTVTSTTVVNGKTHSITDNGHTHTIG